MSDEATKKELELQSVDTNTMPWGELYIEQLKVGIPVKELISDPDTGMSVLKITYKAGFTNVWHHHNCAHGMYVLDGILKTHAGSFGPGSFVVIVAEFQAFLTRPALQICKALLDNLIRLYRHLML